MGERSGRGSGRVGSDFLSAIAGRVGSGQRFAGSGRVGSGPRKVTLGQLWVGAAEAENAEGASKSTLRITNLPHLTGKLARIQWRSLKLLLLLFL